MMENLLKIYDKIRNLLKVNEKNWANFLGI